MFVSESSLSLVGTKVQFLTSEGRVWEGQVDPSSTVDNLKKLLFQHFYREDPLLGPENFRVVFPKESRSLSDSHSISEEKIEENDVLLFIRRRGGSTVPDSDRNLDLHPPTLEDIRNATKDLPPPSTQGQGKPQAKGPIQGQHRVQFMGILGGISNGGGGGTDDTGTETVFDFQNELKRIVVSLISVMETLLRGNQDAEAICQQFNARIKRRLDHLSKKPVEGTTFHYPTVTSIDPSPLGIVHALWEVRKRDFHPNLAALRELKDREGFPEEQVLDALRLTRNAKEAALDLLKSGKKGNDEFEGLDKSSHLFQALVSSPAVRLGLSCPKTLLAFLSILENPGAANTWLNDNDTAPVLSAIFKIYHAEKHASHDQ